MKPVPDIASSVLADVLRRQPNSPGKVALAWQIAAGSKLARVSEAAIAGDGGSGLTLTIRTRDSRWAAEIDRLRPMLVDRLALLLGNAHISLTIV